MAFDLSSLRSSSGRVALVEPGLDLLPGFRLLAVGADRMATIEALTPDARVLLTLWAVTGDTKHITGREHP